MEFRQLSYFLAAASTQNFRQAAELSLVTQPALSRQIAALEKELGTPLFKRIKQHVELTPAGHAFAAYAKETLEILQQGEQEMAHWQQGLVVLSSSAVITLWQPLFCHRSWPHSQTISQYSSQGSDPA